MIARSYDAKPFVKMGAPYFQIKNDLRRHGVQVFSSNYAATSANDVMTLIESMVPATEIYSLMNVLQT